MPLPPRPVRASFDSSPLVRCLAGLEGVAPPPAGQTVAERLSQWLGWTDAIALSAALAMDTTPRPAALRPPAAPRTAADAVERAGRARSELVQAINSDSTFTQLPRDGQACRASYRAHQRDMALRAEAMRASLRAALADKSGEGAQLAALDAVFERALAARERQLLARVPTLLERPRRLPDTATATATATAAASALEREDPPWLAVLLAELDTRWQPIEGLIASLLPDPASSP